MAVGLHFLNQPEGLRPLVKKSMKTEDFKRVHQLAKYVDITKACKIQGVSRNGYYRWLRRRGANTRPNIKELVNA